MKKIIIIVAAFLMIVQGGHTFRTHEHVHYEQPCWEMLHESEVHTSGDTANWQNVRKGEH